MNIKNRDTPDFFKKLFTYKMNAIDQACVWGHLEIVQYYYNIGGKFSVHAMDNACRWGNLKIVQYYFYIYYNFAHSLFQARKLFLVLFSF